ncbi:MAG: glycosyltransferase family 4 protein [Candidatus Harrisonbacteria bacterium]|nr:glycosyltransferase family 4 protein [Candidatus Harrisonbacteria bacterium]
MKKILIATGIYPPDIGGSATYSSLLSGELPKYGHTVKVLAYGMSSQGVPGFIYIISNNWPKGIRHFLYFLKLLEIGRRSDLILAADSSFGAAFISVLAGKILRRKVLVRVTGDYAWEQGVQRFGVKELIDDFQNKNYSFSVELLRKCQSFAVRNADLVIAPSNYLKKIAEGWGAASNKIKVIYNAVGMPDLKISKEEARQALGVSGKVIVSAGRLVPWKGFETLIEAVYELKEEIPDLKLIVIGNGPEEKYLEAKSLKLKANIIFTGVLPKDKLVQYLKAADLFVLNSSYEGFSHQVIEAMSLGLAVAAASVGGNPEVIKSGENGFLFGYNDKQTMKNIIISLFQDSNKRQALGQAAQKTSAQFSQDKMLRSLNNLITIL